MASLYFYSRGRIHRQVLVNDDGSIKVQRGDWLSKYSMAIYTTPFRVREFARMGAHGLRRIDNLNLIYAGETLYHVPTNYASKPSAPEIGPPLPLTNADKERVALGHLVEEYHLRGQDLEVVSKWLHGFAVIPDFIVVLVECVRDVIGFGESAALATVGFWTGALAAILTPVALTFDLVHRLETGERILQMAAIAVGITAWAYEEGPPPYLERWNHEFLFRGSKSQQLDKDAGQDGCKKALDVVEKLLAKIEAAIRARAKPGQTSIPRDLVAKALRLLLRAKYGQQKERMALAAAKTIVEKQKSYEDRELRPMVLNLAATYFNPAFNYHDAE